MPKSSTNGRQHLRRPPSTPFQRLCMCGFYKACPRRVERDILLTCGKPCGHALIINREQILESAPGLHGYRYIEVSFSTGKGL